MAAMTDSNAFASEGSGLQRRGGDTRVDIVLPSTGDGYSPNDAAVASGDFLWSRSMLRTLRNDSTSNMTSKNPKVRSFYVRQGEVLDAFDEVQRLAADEESAAENDDTQHLLAGDRRIHDSDSGASHGHAGRRYTDLEMVPQAPREPGDGGAGGHSYSASGNNGVGGARARSRLLLTVKQATYISMAVNIILFAMKLVALILSGSLSVLSSVVDSALDLFTGIVLFVTQRLMRRTASDAYKYPVGKQRIEPVAIIICASVMGTAALQLIVESVQSIAKGDAKPKVKGLSGAILGMSVVAKFVLYMLCRRVRNPSVQALAVDHRNDTLSNIVAIIFGVMGTLVRNWIDPLGGIIIAVYIIVNWITAGREQVELLVGKAADPAIIQQLTFASLQHSSQVKEVDTVRAYHFGTDFIVEVHVVLSEDMPLKEAHDIGESLQLKLEKLSHVERAFVHLDHESRHHPNQEHVVTPE